MVKTLDYLYKEDKKMAIEFVDEKGTNLNRYKLIPVSGQTNVYDLQRMANVTTPGTPLGITENFV